MGYAAERVNNATRRCGKIQLCPRAYSLSKEITARRLYIEAMEEILGGANAGNLTLIDKQLENFLPISELGGSQGGAK